MDPVSALLLAVIGASFAVSDAGARLRARIAGRSAEHEARRQRERQYEHELRMAKLQQWHAERMAGIAGPTVPEAVATRIRDWQRTSRERMGPVRGFLYDWRADTADRLTRIRREHEQQRARRERWYQRLFDAAAARAQESWDRRERERFQRETPPPPPPPQEEPGPQWWTAERTDQAAEEPASEQPKSRTWDGSQETEADTRFFDLRESGWTGWIDQDGYKAPCPVCGVEACDKGLSGHCTRTDVVDGVIVTPEEETRTGPVPDGPARVPELLGASPAAPTEGAPSMGEIYSPESAKADSDLLQEFGAQLTDKIAAIGSELEQICARLDSNIGSMQGKITGEPLVHYQQMLDKATSLREQAVGMTGQADEVRASAEAAGGYFAQHQDTQSVVHGALDAAPTIDAEGRSEYLEIDSGVSAQGMNQRHRTVGV